ncbi:MAG TPA: SDR family oxidoreductase [Acidimicrobiales bacterium]|nr:SDR family oxidoreductase [Acidimicrobiales bacterium]
MTVPFDLEGATAVITGAGSGIGRATARSFAARGARVAVSDVDGERAGQTAADIVAAGGDAIAVTVNVAHQADLERLRDRCLDRFGGIDIVMNNVGVMAMGAPESLPLEAWQRVLDLNVLSIARSNLAFLPLLLEQGRGHVVNTASASGLLAYGYDRLPYVASKHAVVGITEALAIYLGPKGIGVTCVCPSGVVTNILEHIEFFGASSVPRAPQHRIVEAEGVGELVAEAVVAGRFLVVTAGEVLDELADRAANPEIYMQRMINQEPT